MIKALGNRIIVDVVELKKPKSGSLFLPVDNNQVTARVVAIGGDVDEGLDIGDIVNLRPHCGVEVWIDGEKYLSILEQEVLAAWKDK